jgi:nicotinamide phosphoribosyltransferase
VAQKWGSLPPELNEGYAIMNPLFLKDFYKVGHIDQYPEGTELIFSNFTPRKSRMPGINHAVFFGLKYFIDKYLNAFEFYSAIGSSHLHNYYSLIMRKTLGTDKSFDHIEKLCNLGHLPLAVYALPEGTVVPCGVPALVMFNTHPEFFWLPNMLETILSCTLWGACTSATIAREYRWLLDEFAVKTCDNNAHVDYQAHDFSMRGMFGLEAAIISGMAHLQYFKGTDSIPALIARNQHYHTPFQIASIPATEHSVMSAGGKDSEFDTFKRLICDVYPSGFISIVSDTWNLWTVITDFLPRLKDRIMARDGRVVIRPDSGDPVEIICGLDSFSDFYRECIGFNDYVCKGVIECLWNIFGGTINSEGYKVLDPHIGCIYSDSITLDRARDILERLERKGFAASNIVFGIGSYTYQYNTRDTLGWAMKSTYCERHGVGYPITKDPVTDDGTKKSHSGILKVVKVAGAHGSTFHVEQNCSWDEFHQPDNELKLVYKDGTCYI